MEQKTKYFQPQSLGPLWCVFRMKTQAKKSHATFPLKAVRNDLTVPYNVMCLERE
jgi:hypothetical protein